MSPSNSQLKYEAAMYLASRLPPAKAKKYRDLLRDLRRRSERTAIAGDNAWFDAETPLQFREWDLVLANELDKIYTAVADETKKVAAGTKDAVTDTLHDVGFSLWPLAIAVALVLWSKQGK